VVPTYKALPKDTDPMTYVLSANERRRHMSTGQKAMTAARIANAKHGGQGANQHTKSANVGIPTLATLTLEQAAKAVGVNRATAAEAKAINKADPLVGDLVWEGEMSLREAQKKLKLGKYKPKAKAEPKGKKGSSTNTLSEAKPAPADTKKVEQLEKKLATTEKKLAVAEKQLKAKPMPKAKPAPADTKEVETLKKQLAEETKRRKTAEKLVGAEPAAQPKPKVATTKKPTKAEVEAMAERVALITAKSHIRILAEAMGTSSEGAVWLEETFKALSAEEDEK
jgi:polyhydroxyalkanoate synthesis regulator phasin